MKRKLLLASALSIIGCCCNVLAATESDKTDRQGLAAASVGQPHVARYQRRQELVKDFPRQTDGFTVQEGYEGFMVPHLTGGTAATVLATTIPTAITGGLLGLLGLSALKTSALINLVPAVKLKAFLIYNALKKLNKLRPGLNQIASSQLKPFKPLKPQLNSQFQPVAIQPIVKPVELQLTPISKPVGIVTAAQPVAPAQVQLVQKDAETEAASLEKDVKPEENEARSMDEDLSQRMATLAADVLDKIDRFTRRYAN